MKENNYSLDKNVLSIKTECGTYKFKIDGNTVLSNAQRIAHVMVSETEKIAVEFQDLENKSSPYAKLLLSNLNITDKYVQLENKYNQLLEEHERITPSPSPSPPPKKEEKEDLPPSQEEKETQNTIEPVEQQ